MKKLISSVEWRFSDSPVPYPEALETMEKCVAGILSEAQSEQVWFLEHPPLYTAGTSANIADLIDSKRFPVFDAGRGGQFTYHGPGQRIAYVMLDLRKRNAMDIRLYVQTLERWIISVLDTLGIKGEVREGRIGVWVADGKGSEAKIAAIGIRVRKWITYHGISLNNTPDLSHYAGIIPCGIQEYGVTSLAKLGVDISTQELDLLLKEEFEKLF